MPYYTSFFKNTASKYSFKEYLYHIRNNGVALSENELEKYLHWYQIDMDWMINSKRGLTQSQQDILLNALHESRKLKPKDIRTILDNVKAKKLSGTTIHRYDMRSSQNIFGGNNSLSLQISSSRSPSPSQPPPAPRQQQQQQQPQQRRSTNKRDLFGDELDTSLDHEASGSNSDNKKRIVESDYQASSSDDDDNYSDFALASTPDGDSDDQVYMEPKYDYLVGLGDIDFDDDVMSNPSFSSWMMDDLDISKLFLSHRRNVIKMAHKQQQLSISDQLALNFIFHINADKPAPAHLTTHEWEKITTALSDAYPVADLTPDDCLALYTFSKAARKNINSAVTTLPPRSSATAATATATAIGNLFINVTHKYDGLDDDDMNEDSFVRNRVDPIMSAFFKNEGNIIIRGCTTTLKSSSTSRKQFDPCLRGKLPDMAISLKEEHGTFDIVILEVKPPNASHQDADLRKLGNMLKDSMDKLHDYNLNSAGGRVFGVLIEGYRCDLYVMDLDYTFLYRFYKFGTFHIPCNRYDFNRLVDMVEHMMTLKKLFDKMVVNCHNDVVMLARRGPTTPPSCLKKTKPSFVSPVRLP